MQKEESGHHRKWNGKKHSGGRSRTTQKDQDQHASQAKPDTAFPQYRCDRLLYKQRLVEYDVSFQLCWNVAQGFDGLSYAAYHRDGICLSTLLENRYIHRSLPIYANNVVL